MVELDGKVYVTTLGSAGAYFDPLMYDYDKDRWSSLPALPYARFSLVTVPDRKQLLAIGGVVKNNGVDVISNKVFLWDEENRKWTTPYPNMPTARSYCSSISHGSIVIVAGGITCRDPWTMTRAVEVLHIKEDGWFTKSYWSVVEQLPLVVCNAIPLIINDRLYITVGCCDKNADNTCNVITASLPELLRGSNKSTSSSQVWYKLPDMPYTSFSVNKYQNQLVTFSGCYKMERSDEEKPLWKSVSLIHVYNHSTCTWDCVGEVPYDYFLGRSVHVSNNKILFIGGLAGTYCTGKDDDIVTTCIMLTMA